MSSTSWIGNWSTACKCRSRRTRTCGWTTCRSPCWAAMPLPSSIPLPACYLGTIADRWNRPRLIAAGLLVWSAMTAASGLAQSFWQLAAARVFVAIGEATLTPAAIAMLGDAFPPQAALARLGTVLSGHSARRGPELYCRRRPGADSRHRLARLLPDTGRGGPGARGRCRLGQGPASRRHGSGRRRCAAE